MSQITIYTTPTCGFCKAAKAFFDNHGIAYQEIDVTANPANADEMLQKSGQMGVPVMIVSQDGQNGKEEIVVGFDQAKLAKLLNVSLS